MGGRHVRMIQMMLVTRKNVSLALMQRTLPLRYVKCALQTQEETVPPLAAVQLMGRHVALTADAALLQEEIVPTLAAVQLMGRHVLILKTLVLGHVKCALNQEETVPSLAAVQVLRIHVALTKDAALLLEVTVPLLTVVQILMRHVTTTE